MIAILFNLHKFPACFVGKNRDFSYLFFVCVACTLHWKLHSRGVQSLVEQEQDRLREKEDSQLTSINQLSNITQMLPCHHAFITAVEYESRIW